MKPKKNTSKLNFKRDTVANLNFLNMRMIKAGEPPSHSTCDTCYQPSSHDEESCACETANSRCCLETVFDTCHSTCVSTIISCDC